MSEKMFSFIFAWEGKPQSMKNAVSALLDQDMDDMQVICAGSDTSWAQSDDRICAVDFGLDLARARENCRAAVKGSYIVFMGARAAAADFAGKLRSAVKDAPDIVRLGDKITMSPGCIVARTEFLENNGVSFGEDVLGGAPVYVMRCLEKCGSCVAIDAEAPEIESDRADVRAAAHAFLEVERICLNGPRRDALSAEASEFCRRLGEAVYKGYAPLSYDEKQKFDWSGMEAERCAANIICEMYLKKLRTYVYNKTRPKYAREIYDLDARVRTGESALKSLKSSVSYRVGRLITKPLRMLMKKEEPACPPYKKLPEAPVLPYMRETEGDCQGIIDEIISRADVPRDQLEGCALADFDPAAPMVSVVLPMYNVEKYVGQTYATLKAQTFKNFEMIFVDDGSTDRSPDMVEEFAAADPRVRLVRQKNQFAGVARNNGLKHARGKYVCFLDPDDFFEARMLEKCYAAAEKHGADVTMFSADIYNQKEKFLYRAYYLELASRMPQGRAFTSDEILDNVFMLLNPWTKFYNRQFIIDNGLRYQALYSTNDAHFTMMAMATARSICAVPDVLVHYRINRSGSLQDTKAKNPKNVYEAFHATRVELEKRGLYGRFAAPFSRKALESMLRSLDDLRDYGATRGFYEFLQTEGLSKLGLADCREEIFRLPADHARYERLRRILECPFDEYMFAERLSVYDELQQLKAKIAKK
jgi:glycosyltransferase involved in cell wall biosynthesis